MPLVLDAAREHRVGMLTWVIGAGVFNAFETYALHIEMHDFLGGPKMLAASVLPAAEAMRPLRWPAERLDTLGGYLTYHNILMFQGFLAVYAAVQGVHLVRDPEVHHALEQVLATGYSRRSWLRDRVLGMTLVILAITAGLAASTALSLAWVGEPQSMAAAQSLAAVGLCACVAFAFGLLCGQLLPSIRMGIGAAVIALVVVYVGTNEWQNIGWLGAVRFISPFQLANNSRALVPGVGFDVGSMAGLAGMSVALLVAAIVAFTHRDYGSAYITVRRMPQQAQSIRDPQRWWLRQYWRAQLVRHRIALLAWAASTAAFSALWTGLLQTVSDSWAMSDFFTRFLGAAPGVSVEAMYLSFGCDTVAALVVAYAAQQAAGWVADLREGRLEVLLTAPMSWARITMERIVAALVGCALVALAWIVSGSAMAAWVGTTVDVAGYIRAFVMCMLIGWAGAALAATLAVVTRNTWATTGLVVYVVVAYVLGWFVQVLRWPEWLRRFSVFEAYGHPYREWPPTSNVLVLLAVGAIGTAIAAGWAQRTPKVST